MCYGAPYPWNNKPIAGIFVLPPGLFCGPSGQCNNFSGVPPQGFSPIFGQEQFTPILTWNGPWAAPSKVYVREHFDYALAGLESSPMSFTGPFPVFGYSNGTSTWGSGSVWREYAVTNGVARGDTRNTSFNVGLGTNLYGPRSFYINYGIEPLDRFYVFEPYAPVGNWYRAGDGILGQNVIDASNNLRLDKVARVAPEITQGGAMLGQHPVISSVNLDCTKPFGTDTRLVFSPAHDLLWNLLNDAPWLEHFEYYASMPPAPALNQYRTINLKASSASDTTAPLLSASVKIYWHFENENPTVVRTLNDRLPVSFVAVGPPPLNVGSPGAVLVVNYAENGSTLWTSNEVGTIDTLIAAGSAIAASSNPAIGIFLPLMTKLSVTTTQTIYVPWQWDNPAAIFVGPDQYRSDPTWWTMSLDQLYMLQLKSIVKYDHYTDSGYAGIGYDSVMNPTGGWQVIPRLTYAGSSDSNGAGGTGSGTGTGSGSGGAGVTEL